MLGWVSAAFAAAYVGGVVSAYLRRSLEWSPYPSPDDAQRDMERLARVHPHLCASEIIGRSSEHRPILALRFRRVQASAEAGPRPRLLVTAQIHAVEYIGSYVARDIAHRLAEGYGRDADVTTLLDRADVWMVPLLNPDGAARVWQRGGWSGVGASRFTANGVDPNRNFPFVPLSGRQGWNSASHKPGSPYYRGPHPLSEPECLALARLCKRERFCAAINFHSFGGVVFLPQVLGTDTGKAASALSVFEGVFQSQQRWRRYRPVRERAAKILGQLDPFVLDAFGTPSVTIEVGRPGVHLFNPANAFNVFWWANPARPEDWAANDAAATIRALLALLARTAGTPCVPAHPELAAAVPDARAEEQSIAH
jgi:predicted deacylase